MPVIILPIKIMMFILAGSFVLSPIAATHDKKVPTKPIIEKSEDKTKSDLEEYLSHYIEWPNPTEAAKMKKKLGLKSDVELLQWLKRQPIRGGN